MNFKKLKICMVILLTCLLNIGSDFDEYLKLKNNGFVSIKKSDLPEEFGDGAFDTICDFIGKTRDLTCEWLIYFDYVTGEILQCVKGKMGNVKPNFEGVDFERYDVASLHNHPKDLLSPPSGKNFSILKRDFEDYELIAGFEYFWILMAK